MMEILTGCFVEKLYLGTCRTKMISLLMGSIDAIKPCFELDIMNNQRAATVTCSVGARDSDCG